MAWIKMRTDLHENPHVIRLATLLAIPRLHVLGLVCRFWAWADTYTPDGTECLQGLHPDDLDRIMEHPEFAAAMESVGWLIVTETGIEIPDFDLHMSQSAKRRALTARRVSLHRAQSATPERYASVTAALPEKIREEKKQNKQNNKGIESGDFVAEVLGITGPIPDTFLAAWADWVKHRKEIRHPMTELAAKKAIKKCKEFGYDTAIKAIEFSIASGYRGIFEPGGRGAPGVQGTRLGRCEAPEGKYPD